MNPLMQLILKHSISYYFITFLKHLSKIITTICDDASILRFKYMLCNF